MPLDPRKKAQAAEEGSVGVSAVARLRWERWNQSRAVSVWTTIVEDEMIMVTGLRVGTHQQNKNQMLCCVLSRSRSRGTVLGAILILFGMGEQKLQRLSTGTRTRIFPNDTKSLSSNKWSKKE
jgi:hypothetical protein